MSELSAEMAETKTIHIPKGTVIFGPGDECQNFVYVKSGTVRVDLITKSGKPVLLYRFGTGQTCILTTSCILSGDVLCGQATAEDDVEANIMPLGQFEQKLNASPEFRARVFASFAERLATMMARIEDVTTAPIETRLAACLLERGKGGDTIAATHEELATDIGTVREVVSRKLRDWDNRGLISRKRGEVKIMYSKKLKQIAAERD